MAWSDDKELLAKHFKHAIQSRMVAGYLGNNNGMTRVSILPICPKCERIGLRDKGWFEYKNMACPFCGYTGPTDTVYSEYRKEKKFR